MIMSLPFDYFRNLCYLLHESLFTSSLDKAPYGIRTHPACLEGKNTSLYTNGALCGLRKLITVPDQDKTFYKSVIGVNTYYTVKLIHTVLWTIDLICQPNFSVSYELTDFHISCFYKPEKNLKHLHKSVKLVLVTTCSYYNDYPTISWIIIRGTL